MRRRKFIAQLEGAAASLPLPARVQEAGKVHRIAGLPN
jgi:hypothetical protein